MVRSGGRCRDQESYHWAHVDGQIEEKEETGMVVVSENTRLRSKGLVRTPVPRPVTQTVSLTQVDSE